MALRAIARNATHDPGPRPDEAAPVKLLTGGTKFKYQQNATKPPVPGTHRAHYQWSVDANPTGDAIKTSQAAASAASAADDRYRDSQGEQ